MRKSLFFMALCLMAMVSQAQYYYIKPTMWDNIKSTQIELSLGGGGYFGLPTCSSLAPPTETSEAWDPIRKMEYANKFTPAFKFSFELETSHTGWYFGTFTDLEFNMDSYEANLYGENICDETNPHYEAEFEGKRFLYKNSYLNAAFAHGFKVGSFFFDETVEAYFGAGAQIRYSIMEWETTEVSCVNTAVSESKESYATPGRLQLGIIGRVGVNYRVTDNLYVGLSVIGDIYPIDLDNIVDRFGTAPVNGSSLGKPSKKESKTEESIAALTPNVKVVHEGRRSIFTFLSIGWYWNKKYKDRTFDGY